VRVIQEARKAHDWERIRAALLEMRQLAPNNLDVALSLAQNAMRLGDRAGAIHWLDVYAAAGLTFDLAGEATVAPLVNDPGVSGVTGHLSVNAKPISRAARAFALPKGDQLFEDVAWDPSRRRLYVSSVRGRNVVAVDVDGTNARALTKPERDGLGVLGVAMDPSGRVLWISEAPLPQVPGFRRGDDVSIPSAVVAIDPGTGQVLKRIDLPVDGAAHALTDLAVTSTGEVLASDAVAGALYIVRPSIDRFERLSAGFNSPQTPAPAREGTTYVADYSLGIALVDTRTGSTSWLRAPPDVALSGIDGLYFAGGALVAVQNGTLPRRIVRFALAGDGLTVTRETVIEAGTPGLGDPTHGAVLSGELWFLASTGWARFDENGALVKDAPPDAPAIWRVRIAEAP
jgi:hypothetical protein